MSEADSLVKASEYAKSAMLRMEFLGLAPTPNNFALMYAYASGRLPQIKGIVDEAVRKGGINPAHAQEIYDKYLGGDDEKKILENNVKALSGELARVMEIISQTNAGASQFNESLSGFTKDISKPQSVDQLRAAVSRMAEETKQIAEKNQKLQQELDQSSKQMVAMKEDLSRVQKESLTDALTGIGNRKHFTNELKRMVFEADDTKTPLSLLMIDIDFFKKFNDTHGHLVGDQVLKLVGRTLMENLKGKDAVCRYGGEEFVILLPQTKLSDANKVADALRTSVAQKKIVRRDNNQTLGAVTISIGVAQYHSGEQMSGFLKRADAGLYMAKNAGRNRVVTQELDPATVAKLTQGVKDPDRFAELDSNNDPAAAVTAR